MLLIGLMAAYSRHVYPYTIVSVCYDSTITTGTKLHAPVRVSNLPFVLHTSFDYFTFSMWNEQLKEMVMFETKVGLSERQNSALSTYLDSVVFYQ